MSFTLRVATVKPLFKGGRCNKTVHDGKWRSTALLLSGQNRPLIGDGFGHRKQAAGKRGLDVGLPYLQLGASLASGQMFNATANLGKGQDAGK
jgi:hypothetical protein